MAVTVEVEEEDAMEVAAVEDTAAGATTISITIVAAEAATMITLDPVRIPLIVSIDCMT